MDTGFLKQQSFQDKYLEVKAWLKNVMPTYDFNHEISSSQIDTLLCLKRYNEGKDTACRAAIEDLKEKTAEYDAESKNMSALLSGLLLSTQKLDSHTSEIVNSMANLSVTLEIQNTGSEASFHTELYNILDSLEKITEENEEIANSTAVTNAKTVASAVQLAKIERILQDVSYEVKSLNHQVAAKEKNWEFLKNKSDDYVKRAEKHMAVLRKHGYSESFTHERLVEKFQGYLVLQQHVLTLQQKIDSFHGLPSNVSLATIKLSEAKEELKSIKQELKTLLDE